MGDLRRVIMRMNISGGRADGRLWPPTGHELILPAAEAEDLIRGGMAWAHPEGYDVADEGIPAAPSATAAELSPPAETAAGPVAAGEAPAPAATGEGDPVPPDAAPVSYAPKQAWVDWAVAQGADPEAVNAMTKAELQERYGDRP